MDWCRQKTPKKMNKRSDEKHCLPCCLKPTIMPFIDLYSVDLHDKSPLLLAHWTEMS
ncbi:hypothetical protein ACFOEM_02480 [Paenalcaligenes hominis]|uniref:hypothetical protein n=1 Tax=Paenalcaligenes hominis TaxID=643674 RepID=UPI0036211A53